MFQIEAAVKGCRRRKDDIPALCLLVGPMVNCNGQTLSFEATPGPYTSGGLLSQMITSEMDEQLRQIRREAYNCGYAEGRQHTSKRTEFYSDWSQYHVGFHKD